MYPPHLPPPTCNVEQHRQWRRLKYIGVATFFGLLAGVTGAAVAVAFIWPYSDVTTAIVSRIPRFETSAKLNEETARLLAGTIFEVYEKSVMIGAVQYVAPQDRLGSAVVGVSAGWLVASVPDFDGSFKDWRVLSETGNLFQVERVLPDHDMGLLYIKIKPLRPEAGSQEQLKVVQFASTVASPSLAFVRESGGWMPANVLGVAAGDVLVGHSDLTTALRIILGGRFRDGSVVVSSDGTVLGFVEDSNRVVPALGAVSMLTGIEDRKSLSYPSIGVEGWFNEEWPILIDSERVDGFFVNRVVGKTPLKRGDILSQVNGRPVTFQNWWSLRNEREITVEVLRQRQTILITLIR